MVSLFRSRSWISSSHLLVVVVGDFIEAIWQLHAALAPGRSEPSGEKMGLESASYQADGSICTCVEIDLPKIGISKIFKASTQLAAEISLRPTRFGSQP